MAKSAANAFCLQLQGLQTVVAPGASWQPNGPREPGDLPSHKAKAQDAVWGASKNDYALQRAWIGPCRGLSDRYLVWWCRCRGAEATWAVQNIPTSHCLAPERGEVKMWSFPFATTMDCLVGQGWGPGKGKHWVPVAVFPQLLKKMGGGHWAKRLSSCFPGEGGKTSTAQKVARSELCSSISFQWNPPLYLCLMNKLM